MKVKTLLKTLDHIAYNLVDLNGNHLDSDYISDQYYGESALYEDREVETISISAGLNPELFITIK